MFSYFKNGIKDTVCSKFIDLHTLVGLVRNNPEVDKITQIRTRRNNGDSSYKQLKEQLPNITPNCMVSKRVLNGENFNANFLQASGYIYFDFDIKNAEEYKKYFIEKYGDKASFVCLSASNGGIATLFKVKNPITNENFDVLRNYIIDNILSGEPIDKNAGGIGRAMFISHDPDVYVDFENEIKVELADAPVKPSEKRGKQSNSSTFITNRLISPFSVITIDKVYEKLYTCTQVEVINPVVDFKPVEFVEVYIPEIIKDGTKHTIYQSMIHHLVYLNPDIEKEYIFSFLFYVNNRFAKPRMDRIELIRFFNLVYYGIKKTGTMKYQQKTKYVHFNENYDLSTKQKLQIANTLNGYQRRNISIRKIQEVKHELKQSVRKSTQKNIAEISGLSPKTVRAHLNSDLIDMNEMVKMINDSVYAGDSTKETDKSTSTTGNVFKQFLAVRKDKDPLYEPAPPDCHKLTFFNCQGG
jgi:hypothetical protein